MEKLYVYVSGPLHSSGRAQINVRNACLEAEQLLEGNTDIVPIVPHLMMYWDAMAPHDAGYWLHIDKGLLLGCDVVLRIKGESVGGDMEVEWAKEADIPVYYSTGAIVMAYEKGLFEKKGAAPVESGVFNLRTLQEEIAPWVEHNFGDRPAYHPLLGVGEEVRELMHSHLKSEQGIRGTADEHHAKKCDAVADIIVFLADYCNAEGIDMQASLEQTWAEVKKRDWKKNNRTGKEPVDLEELRKQLQEKMQPPTDELVMVQNPTVTTASGAEKPALPTFRYKVDQQVKSLSGRGGFGVGVIKATRMEAGKPFYNCTFGAFTGWVPEGDIDPIIMGADISEGGDQVAITVMQQQGDGYVQVKLSLTEGDECMLAANPYRASQRVRLISIDSAEWFRVEGIEDGKTYIVTSHELRPISDDTTGATGGAGA